MKDKANKMRLAAYLYRLFSNLIIKCIQVDSKYIECLKDDVFER